MSKGNWQFQEAKNRFSEVVDLAMKEGAQTVTKEGRPAVVVISVEDYKRSRNPKKSLVAALRACPEDLSGWVSERSKEPSRTLSFE